MSALLSSFAASLQEEEEQALTTQSDLAFTPRPSLWEHVSSLLQPAERNEAKLVIGSSTILDNQQLHNEVRSLVDIVTCLQTTHTPHTTTLTTEPTSSSSTSIFSVPNGIPLLRLRGFEADRTEHLKDEIAHLIAAIRDKARQKGESDTGRIWSPRSDRERSIVAMVEKESAGAGTSRSSVSRSSRCSTARPSTASTARSASYVSTSASRPVSSSVSSLTSSVASLSSLSIFTLDSAVSRIQAALQEEKEELLRDIDYLRSIIEDEEEQADERRKDEEEQQQQESVVAPSEMELRALNKQLKAAVAEEESAERTRRLLSAVPDRATFKTASKPLMSLHTVKADRWQQDCKQIGSEEKQRMVEVVQTEESVESMLSSLDDLEAAFFHHRDAQSTTASSAPSTPSPPIASFPPAIPALPLPSTPSSTASRRSSSSVFSIRPSSSSSSSASHSSAAASSPRSTRTSPLPKVRAVNIASKSTLSKRVILPQLVT